MAGVGWALEDPERGHLGIIAVPGIETAYHELPDVNEEDEMDKAEELPPMDIMLYGGGGGGGALIQDATPDQSGGELDEDDGPPDVVLIEEHAYTNPYAEGGIMDDLDDLHPTRRLVRKIYSRYMDILCPDPPDISDLDRIIADCQDNVDCVLEQKKAMRTASRQ